MPRHIVRLLLAVLILASLFGGRSLVANVADGHQHVVKPGETLGAIAAHYGLTIGQLATLNGLADPDRLAEGQVLELPPSPGRQAASNTPPSHAAAPAGAPASPSPASAAPAGRSLEYVVQAGDTLSGIAKGLGISLRALMEANGLADPDRLTVGQRLAVPAGAAPAGPSVPAARSGQPSAGQPAATASNGQTTSPTDETSLTMEKLAQQYGVDPALVRALAWIDTDGRPARLVTPGGVGYLAVTDKTFEYVQQALVKRTLDRSVAADNLEAGVAYVASMLKWGGDEAKGLAGFLQGPGSVRANGVRPAIEQEVKRILALRDRLKQEPASARAVGLGAGTGQSASPGTAPQPKLTAAEGPAGVAARAIGAARSVAGPNARVGIAGRNLVTGQRLGVASDQSFPAASVNKLALLVEVYRQSAGGTLALTDERRADVRAMIVSSDNDAANRLLELLGQKSVNANLQAIGLVGTRLGNPFGLASAVSRPANVTTPGDMAKLMEMLASEQLVSSQASREMRGLLLQSQDGSKLKRGLPSEARIAHKSGWYDGVANDVGIISHRQSSYVLSVFTEGIPDAETANHTIAAVAEVVHALWGPGE